MSEMQFASVMQEERERLHKEREQIFNQQQELENKLAEINRELAAIDAYEQAKSGKAIAAVRAPRGPRRQRAPRGSRREALLQLIKETPDGLGRGELLERMELKGDKSGEMAVSNALSALSKTNQIVRRERKYFIA